MAYISTSCVKHPQIIDSIKELIDAGFNCLELSGGTKPYPAMESDLINIVSETNVELLLHNYFPPPHEDFVLNLGSADNKIYQQSIEHVKRAIDLSVKIGASKFAFHAGFYIDIKLEEIGKNLTHENVSDKNKALDRFCSAHTLLTSLAGKDVKLYVENNVYSKSNHTTFKGVNPLMVTDVESMQELQSMIDFNLLLDVAHLKVSCQTLGYNFEDQLKTMFNLTDYIHISDNDGTHDTNEPLIVESDLFTQLSQLDWTNKTTTIEVYDTLDLIKQSMDNFNSMSND